jgi:glutathione S-transferase
MIMAIELYWGSGSPFAWRALLTLEWKKIPYTSRLLEFSKGEHKAPGYLAMNPRGKVPVLRDGDVTLYETLSVMNYLERKHPEPAVFGATPAEAGRIWREISECLYYLEQPAFTMIVPILFGGASEQAAELKASAETLHTELARLETILAGQPWLAGDAPSAADIWVYPLLKLAERAASKEVAQPLDLGLAPLAARYPAIGRWQQRVESQPGYERTYPPHWKMAA